MSISDLAIVCNRKTAQSATERSALKKKFVVITFARQTLFALEGRCMWQIIKKLDLPRTEIIWSYMLKSARERFMYLARHPISNAAASQLQISKRSNYIRCVASTMEIRQTVWNSNYRTDILTRELHASGLYQNSGMRVLTREYRTANHKFWIT